MNAERGTRSAESNPATVLVCFAVRDEAKHFQPPPGASCQVLVSGIGKCNAERALIDALTTFSPQLVLTCGYAGGLDSRLPRGAVVFDADDEKIASRLRGAGAVPAKFFCAEHIAVTAADKLALRNQTGADAVEMESGVIRELCRLRGVPAATIRVISDDANADLPLDFNRLAGADGNIRYAKLAGALLKSPGLVPKLMRFQRELDECSHKLAAALHGLLAGRAG
jgi:adenosylhomocysteine nucleosidase